MLFARQINCIEVHKIFEISRFLPRFERLLYLKGLLDSYDCLELPKYCIEYLSIFLENFEVFQKTFENITIF